MKSMIMMGRTTDFSNICNSPTQLELSPYTSPRKFDVIRDTQSSSQKLDIDAEIASKSLFFEGFFILKHKVGDSVAISLIASFEEAFSIRLES